MDAITVDLEMAGNEIRSVSAEVLPSAPTPLKIGHFYYDSTVEALGVWGGAAWDYITNGGGSSTLGGLLGVAFVRDSNVNNKWLKLSSSRVEDSNVSPWVAPMAGSVQFVGMSNKKTSNWDAEIYVNGSQVQAVEFRGVMMGHATLATPITFSAGDTLSVYAQSAGGTQPDSIIFYLYVG